MPPALQTKKSNYQEEAKGTTKEEFKDIMKVLASMARLWFTAVNRTPRFSWDNASIQKNADFKAMGIEEHEKVPLAPYMPDGHQVIEHAFANLKRALWEDLYYNGDVKDAIDAQQRVKAAFYSYEQQSVYKNTHNKLVLCLQQIATPKGVTFVGVDKQLHEGTGGDWARSLQR